VSASLARRRALRRNSTDAENALWSRLRAKRFEGFKFRRQHPCGPFILDFYCPARHLAVELDGGQHFEPSAQSYDDRRTAYLRRRGINVLRFPTDLAFREPDAVLESIALALGGPSPVPSPLRGEGTGMRRHPPELPDALYLDDLGVAK
jgi:very-short-patch-repair endonuclease